MRLTEAYVAWGVLLEVHRGWSVTDRPFRRRPASEIPDSPEIPDFPELPEGPVILKYRKSRRFRTFRIDSVSDFRRFSRLRHMSDSTRSVKARTFVFAGRRGTFKGSLMLQKYKISMKIAKKSVRCRFAHEPHEEKSIFSFPDATARRFWLPRRAPGRPRALFLASQGVLGGSPCAPGTRQDAPGTLPSRSRETAGTLLGATGRPERAPRPILTRFWETWSLCRDRL